MASGPPRVISAWIKSRPLMRKREVAARGTTLSTAITTVANHALITDCAIGQANGGLTIRAGQTTRVDRLTTGSVDGVGVSTVNDKAVAGSETMDWTQAEA